MRPCTIVSVSPDSRSVFQWCAIVALVQSKQADAKEITQKVLLGESDQLHQSVIAMQEAGVSFSLMVEVRNKLIESYQELMRMQV